MTNREKYIDMIKNYQGMRFCDDFVKPVILKISECTGIDCTKCQLVQKLWLDEEYVVEIPEVDWSKVAVDTPILVKVNKKDEWEKRHFAKYEDGKVYAWTVGGTSWTSCCCLIWKYAKLAEDGEV